MPLDDDGDEDAPAAGPPLPPDDRLWRHPSELSGTGVRAPARSPVAAGRPRTRGVVIVAATAGATLAVGLLAVVQGLPRTLDEVSPASTVAASVTQAFVGNRYEAVRTTTRIAPSMAAVEATVDGATTRGSAVVIRDDGYLVTAAHLVAGAGMIRVVTSDGRTYDADRIGSDPVTDLVVLRIRANGLRPAAFATDSAPAVGERTFAIGCPAAPGEPLWLAMGAVRALRRSLAGVAGETLHGLIETDAPVVPAAAGGALVNTSGVVVGLTTSGAGDERARESGFATPAQVVADVAEDIIATGAARHVWLGVEGGDLDTVRAKALGVGGGALVQRVVAPSPAADAGLADGDVIVEVDGIPVRSMSELVASVREHDDGEQVEVTYIRGDERAARTITLAEK